MNKKMKTNLKRIFLPCLLTGIAVNWAIQWSFHIAGFSAVVGIAVSTPFNFIIPALWLGLTKREK